MSKNNRLVFLPLGGTGEIGMNMNLYGYGQEIDEIILTTQRQFG